MASIDPWDEEYRRGGIPSSYREEPSTALVWALENWHFLSGRLRPESALDCGCGTGRNARHLASLGIDVLGFDSSRAALEVAHRRESAARFLQHDLREGLPAPDASVDLEADIFVYKHLTAPDLRARYRAELARVLRTAGLLLVSLAEPDDGFYAACPPADGSPRAVVDPFTGIASVLFTLEDLQHEFADRFRLEMAWRRQKPGPMHGATYVRCTLATIWRVKDAVR